jgi:hypothetical protein
MAWYKFIPAPDRKSITIENPQGISQEWSVEALETLVRSSGTSAPVRAMAEDALRRVGIRVEIPEPEARSGTLTIIKGVKIYQSREADRLFFFERDGERISGGSISELESKIKETG